MKERPILFSAPMVRAILDGSKTQTRRMVKLPHNNPLGVWEPFWFGGAGCHDRHGQEVPGRWTIGHSRTGDIIGCPIAQPGDRLWVREAFSGPWCMEAQDGSAAAPPSKWDKSSRIWYWADGEPTYGDWTRPRPSIHMPRWASRITLEVTGVRVERLQDISEADAEAEGIARLLPPPAPHDWSGPNRFTLTGMGNGACAGSVNWNAPTARALYHRLWESINGPGSWDLNPWVWVIEFKRVKP